MNPKKGLAFTKVGGLNTASPKPTTVPHIFIQKIFRTDSHYDTPRGSSPSEPDTPHPPLTSNSIGRITKQELARFHIPPSWGPHSTRGAGVALYKALGLSSEAVCEIGQWKNFSAFQEHYLRLGAATQAADKIQQFLVHKDSPGVVAEPEQSQTHGTFRDQGGSDWEGKATTHGEPTQPKPKPKRAPTQPTLPHKPGIFTFVHKHSCQTAKHK